MSVYFTYMYIAFVLMYRKIQGNMAASHGVVVVLRPQLSSSRRNVLLNPHLNTGYFKPILQTDLRTSAYGMESNYYGNHSDTSKHIDKSICIMNSLSGASYKVTFPILRK